MQQLERMRFGRIPIAESTRVLLCDLAAADLERPLSRFEDVDWEEVFQCVSRNGLLGLTCRYLKRQPETDYPPKAFQSQVTNAHRLDALRMALKYRHVLQVLAHLSECGLEYMVVKGPAVAYVVYPEPSLRSFNDLDLVVREKDWTRAHQLLVDQGFVPQEDMPEPPPKVIPQEVLYELKYWHPEVCLLVEVHFDDILNAGLSSRDVEGFWQRTKQISVKGQSVRVMSLEDQLLHLCMHMHYHGYTRLNAFSDVALIVRDHAAELDWEQFLRTVHTEQSEVGVYYSFLFMERLLGQGIPPKVLQVLKPGPVRRALHELWMPESRVLSLQPMWRPDFSFYFQPLLKRLLPDLLVMGRGGEKLRYLMRLLVPPSAWLRHYYHIDAQAWIGIHYVLHPLKLTVHYISEIAQAVLHPRKWFAPD